MIVDPLSFDWKVTDEGVSFSVWQNPMHILTEKYYSKGKIPPLGERLELLRRAGYSEQVLNRITKNHMQWKKDSDKNQKKLDAIFMKFNVKPTTVKKKVLKPVKKSSVVIKV